MMRARTHFLGVVYAADEKSAEAAAIAEFKIGEDQRRRLIVREQEWPRLAFSNRRKMQDVRHPQF